MTQESPLTQIPELAGIPRIRSFHDLVSISDFVFGAVPWLAKPTDLSALSVKGVADVYRRFRAREMGGWCGINAEYLQHLLYWYRVKTRPYNFGLRGHGITHVGVVAEYDCMEFFLDPYLGLHYAHRDGFPLTFQALQALVGAGRLDKVVPVRAGGVKFAEVEGGWQALDSEGMQRSVMGSWPEYNSIMVSIFGSTGFLQLMQLPIPGEE